MTTNPNNRIRKLTRDAIPLSEQSDEQVFLAYRKNRDETLFGEIVRRYKAPLHAHLLRMLGDWSSADDVLQNTFLQIHLRAESFDGERRLRPWLYSIATNQAIDHMRRNRRHQAMSLSWRSDNDDQQHGAIGDALAMADDRISPPAELEAKENREWVRREVGKLSKPFREVFVRTHLRGFSVAKTAEELGLPLGTVKSRNHSAREKLLRAWQLRRRTKDK